jgi:glycosyltransferase involved in cell wall biosynthesis
MMSQMKITLIVPTLNELKGTQTILPQIKPEWYDQLIVVDGNSTDGTKEWCLEHGYSIFLQKKKGMWNAYKEVFEAGIITGDIVITFSPDGNSIPELIPQLVEKMANGYDMVIASRYMGNAKSYDDTKITAFGNHVFNAMINVFSGRRYTDSMVLYRAYKTNIVQELGFLGEVPLIYRMLLRLTCLVSWEPSMSIRCKKKKYSVCEIPGDEPANITLNGKRRENWFIQGFILGSQILYEGVLGWTIRR